MSTTSPKQSDSDLERKEKELDQASQQAEQSAQKTQFLNTSTDKTGVVGTGETNVLNNYRSVSYIFTLAGLAKDYLKDPGKYRSSELDLVILKSGGKGFQGITPPTELSSAQSQAVSETVLANDPTVGAGITENNIKNIEKLKGDNNSLVTEFNQKSPGRFDMFIENIEIESFMSASEEGNTSKPTKITFDVIEPFSINGFIESLHVAAVSAGYTSYNSTPFLLKVEFSGYPDNEDLPEPVIIPNTTRYFPIVFTKMSVEVTERGTRYRCQVLPVNDRAYGESNKLKKQIKMVGDTVKDILTDLMENLTKQNARVSPDADPLHIETDNFEITDIYEIKFPSKSTEYGWQDSPENEIAGQMLTEITKDASLPYMIPPEESNKPNGYQGKNNNKQQTPPSKNSTVRYGSPYKTVVHFNEGAMVDSIISAVIRDSLYVKNILKNIKDKVDEYGMIDYFAVNIQVENLEKISPVTKEPFKKYTYVVTPYKVHISRVQPYGSLSYPEKKLKKLSRREYNYLYTGQNIDVINFKLDFNYLFFEAVPPSMGNKETPSSKGTAVKDQSSNIQVAGTPVDQQSEHEVPLPPTRATSVDVQATGGNALQPRNDPYSTMAKAMHEAIINSKSALLKGELEILGDPFYLVTGGMGNYNPKLKNQGETEDGEAAYQYSEVLVTINFRNPVDINPDTGMLDFDPNRIPFSGVYRVIRVKHSFKEGVFRQKIEVMRFNGQVLDQKVDFTDPDDMLRHTPNPAAQPVNDTSRAESTSVRASSESVEEQLGRGLPEADRSTNFTGAVGGLGGNDNLNQTPGQVPAGSVINGINNPNSIIPTPIPIVSQTIGQPLPVNDLASNIRLKTSGLFDLNKSSLGSASLVAAAANVLTGNLPKQRLTGLIAGSLLGTALNNSLQRSNQGSGIGEGATVKLNSDFVPSTEMTSVQAKQGNNFSNFVGNPDSLTDTAASVSNLGTNAVSNVIGLGGSVNRLVGGVGEKLQGLTAPNTDPLNIVARGGLDSTQMSGLSNYTSKINPQIESLIKNTPQNVDLEKAANQGVILNYLPTSKLANLPPQAPFQTAPEPGQSLIDEAAVSAAQGTNIDRNIFKDKVTSAKNNISSLTGLPNVNDNILGAVNDKFGSLTAGKNPLDKLMRKTTT